MRTRNATHPIRTLLAAALGVSLCSGAAASMPQKKGSANTPSTGHATGTKSSPGSKSGNGKSKGKSGKRSSKSSRRQKGQTAPTADRISEIQQALAKDGSFAGTPNGKWDDSTVEAMKRFQEAHGLNPSGKLDAKTLQQLGLGSQTAGAAPPTVSAPSMLTGSAQTARRQ